jgi:hypothetical protein
MAALMRPGTSVPQRFSWLRRTYRLRFSRPLMRPRRSCHKQPIGLADSPDGRAFEDVLDAAGVLGYLRATADTLLFLRQTSESVSPRSFRYLLNSTQVAFHAATLRTVLETLIHAAEAGEEPLPALLLNLGSREWETARLRAQGSALRRRRRSHG